MVGMNYGFFDAEGFKSRLAGLTDSELIATGKSVAPGVSRSRDSVSIEHSARKHELCKEEWRQRCPRVRDSE